MAASSLLLNSEIDNGLRLIELLEHGGFSVKAAYWLYDSDQEKWTLQIATDDLSVRYGERMREVAGILHGWRKNHPEDADFTFLDVRWLDAKDKVVSGLSNIVHMNGRREVRLSHRLVNGVYLEDVIIHRMAA